MLSEWCTVTVTAVWSNGKLSIIHCKSVLTWASSCKTPLSVTDQIAGCCLLSVYDLSYILRRWCAAWRQGHILLLSAETSAQNVKTDLVNVFCFIRGELFLWLLRQRSHPFLFLAFLSLKGSFSLALTMPLTLLLQYSSRLPYLPI